MWDGRMKCSDPPLPGFPKSCTLVKWRLKWFLTMMGNHVNSSVYNRCTTNPGCLQRPLPSTLFITRTTCVQLISSWKMSCGCEVRKTKWRCVQPWVDIKPYLKQYGPNISYLTAPVLWMAPVSVPLINVCLLTCDMQVFLISVIYFDITHASTRGHVYIYCTWCNSGQSKR